MNFLHAERANLLVLAPVIRTPVAWDRDQLVKAVIGEQALAVYVSLDGTEAPPPEPTFLQTGKLAKIHRGKDGQATTDLTRISAVMSVEAFERDDDEGNVYTHHFALVVHNPFAAVPLSSDLFGDMPQLIHGDGEMYWNDKHTICAETWATHPQMSRPVHPPVPPTLRTRGADRIWGPGSCSTFRLLRSRVGEAADNLLAHRGGHS